MMLWAFSVDWTLVSTWFSLSGKKKFLMNNKQRWGRSFTCESSFLSFLIWKIFSLVENVFQKSSWLFLLMFLFYICKTSWKLTVWKMCMQRWSGWLLNVKGSPFLPCRLLGKLEKLHNFVAAENTSSRKTFTLAGNISQTICFTSVNFSEKCSGHKRETQLSFANTTGTFFIILLKATAGVAETLFVHLSRDAAFVIKFIRSLMLHMRSCVEGVWYERSLQFHACSIRITSNIASTEAGSVSLAQHTIFKLVLLHCISRSFLLSHSLYRETFSYANP